MKNEKLVECEVLDRTNDRSSVYYLTSPIAALYVFKFVKIIYNYNHKFPKMRREKTKNYRPQKKTVVEFEKLKNNAENMQRIWGWICDRKTNTIRKWRSTLVRRPPSDETDMCYLKNGRQAGHSVSDLNLPSTSKDIELEYEEFFDDPQTKTILDGRSSTFKEHRVLSSIAIFEGNLGTLWQRKSRTPPCGLSLKLLGVQ
ncbi:hypothetical protein KIN20_033642 [Parelaphostrongylus tenuis]|uniref:Uncharacterized protein n=1 Tax=Parelaphostrongylus tenuis TaxID=148309 RepID=A0AAD5R8X8_PARTN|nr:hypothetical protein KIN20_033642 [Parelaphostrongylus tenuis]